jgi:predicted PurR-regulated permease PerM
MDSPRTRKLRRMVLGIGVALMALALSVYLLWSLRAIILPVLVGAFVAYLCIPVVDWFESKGVPRTAAIVMLFALFLLGLVLAVRQVQNWIPDEREKIELRIRVQYKVNEAYARLMGLDETLRKGNTLYQVIGSDTDPFIDRLNLMLMPTRDEREILRRSQEGELAGKAAISDRVFQYYVANTQTVKKRLERAVEEQEALPGAPLSGDAAPAAPDVTSGWLATFREILSVWFIMPFMFLFLLLDNGQMMRRMIRLVPNRYFELTLTLVDDVDRAIGAYVRGTLLECGLVALSLAACFSLIGIPPEWTVAISLLAGVANAIPYVGTVVSLSGGLAYALLAESVAGPLPFVNAGNLWLWVAGSVGLVRFLDDTVFVPVVLGGAVHLHPMVMILAIVGGSILFGVAGTLFAIPAIVVLNVLVGSIVKNLRAYYLI